MKNDQKHAALLNALQKRLGISFNDQTLLKTACTHRSYLNETHSPKAHKDRREHNERLEFLGDAVLELVVTDLLFRQYPDASEGDMTSYRAALVNAVMLGGIAETLGMNECLLLSRGEAKDTGRARATILANTFEAVVGALYLDRGIEEVFRFTSTHVMPHMKEVLEQGTWRDSKSLFQEFAQAHYGITPTYEVLSAEGPDHDRRFVIGLSVGETRIAEGEGKSKQEAEQDAARKALDGYEKH